MSTKEEMFQKIGNNNVIRVYDLDGRLYFCWIKYPSGQWYNTGLIKNGIVQLSDVADLMAQAENEGGRVEIANELINFDRIQSHDENSTNNESNYLPSNNSNTMFNLERQMKGVRISPKKRKTHKHTKSQPCIKINFRNMI